MSYLDQFTEELHNWSLTGKEPSCAAGELRYYLNCQEKRLKDNEIEREEDYIHVKDEIHGSVARNENGYTANMLYREANQTIIYRKNGKEIKKISRPVTIYATMLDKEGYEERMCTCPNCGHTFLIREARDGCPYCGTFFEMDETYPCFTSYYTVPGITERGTLMDRLKKGMIIAGCISGILLAGISFYAWDEMQMIFRILASLFMGAFYGLVFAFLWYMGQSMILLMKVFFEAGRSLPLLKSLKNRKKMNSFMEAYDPGFQYDVFEGKVISMLQTITFSDHRESLSVWNGDRDLHFLDSISDMQYRGAIYVQKCKEVDGILHLEVIAYMTDTYIKGSVHEKDEAFKIILEKEASALFDPGFLIQKVSCTGCGGSFDAIHQKTCPYCKKPYDLKKKDWIVKDLEKK